MTAKALTFHVAGGLPPYKRSGGVKEMSPVKVREIIFPSVSFEGSPPIRKRLANEKATDDYHYEKFKKMNRRY